MMTSSDETSTPVVLTPGEAGDIFTPRLSAERVRQLIDGGHLKITARTLRGMRLVTEQSVRECIAQREAARRGR